MRSLSTRFLGQPRLMKQYVPLALSRRGRAAAVGCGDASVPTIGSCSIIGKSGARTWERDGGESLIVEWRGPFGEAGARENPGDAHLAPPLAAGGAEQTPRLNEIRRVRAESGLEILSVSCSVYAYT